MGLTAKDFNAMARLAGLAADSDGASRADIYLAVASLYRNQAEVLSDRERALVHDILRRVAGEVEMAVRIALAERVADDPQAPLDLIYMLVDDCIEVARPIILRSPKLTDRGLLNLIAESDVARQTAFAERPRIGLPVTAALAESDAVPVHIALVRNISAQIAPATFERLVEKSRYCEAMQELLAKRDDLPTPLAWRMCEWVSEAVRSYLASTGRLEPQVARGTLGIVAQSLQSSVSSMTRDVEANAGKLVDKLATAGQLRPGFLVRVLQQGQVDLFDLAFARLLELQVGEFRRSFYLGGPKPVALACRAVGIDKSVFSTVFDLSRRAYGAPSSLTPHERGEVERAFASLSRQDARAQLHIGH